MFSKAPWILKTRTPEKSGQLKSNSSSRSGHRDSSRDLHGDTGASTTLFQEDRKLSWYFFPKTWYPVCCNSSLDLSFKVFWLLSNSSCSKYLFFPYKLFPSPPHSIFLCFPLAISPLAKFNPNIYIYMFNNNMLQLFTNPPAACLF